MTELSPELQDKLSQLLALLESFESCAVACSGGVDSAVLAQAAHLALGASAVAVTGVSDSLAQGELDVAREMASRIGIRHEIVGTQEFENDSYARNAPDRCFHCKTELYTQLEALAPLLNVAVLVNGANLDDRGDHRPGMVAAQDHQVRSPLLECGMTKADIRQLAAHWDLPVWDKPASPCLSSRIAYGEEVTPQRVRMVDEAERFLREQGVRELRVRYHRGDHARVEVPAEWLPRLCASPLRESLTAHFKALGFKLISLDLEGFRSGSLNELLPVDQLRVLS